MSKQQQRVLGRILAQELPRNELAAAANAAGGIAPNTNPGTARRVGTQYLEFGITGTWDDGLQLDGSLASPFAPLG